MKESKDFRAEAIKHLNALKTIEEKVYAAAKRIVKDLTNYEIQEGKSMKVGLKTAVNNIVQLADATGETPYFNFTALSDLLDDEKVGIYPFIYMQREATMQVETLYSVALMVHLVTDKGDHSGDTISFEPEE